jgi:hypothetical protein
VTGAADAMPITFAYTGTITQVAALDPANPFPIEPAFGSPFSGSFTFDSTALDLVPADTTTGSYSSFGSPYELRVNIGGLELAYGGVSIAITRGYSSIGFGFDEYLFSFFDGGNPTPAISARLTFPGGTFATDALPLTPMSLTTLYDSAFLFSDIIDGNQVELGGQIDSLTPVPEPATVSLVVAGFGALMVRRRRVAQRT